MCRVLEVSTSGYYAWRQREPSQRQRENQTLSAQIDNIFQVSRQTYGRHRVRAELDARGYPCGHNRVARLMRGLGLRPRRYRRHHPRTTQSKHGWPIAPNLLAQDFRASRPNQKWLADITYIPTAEGWLYLAAVEDTFSRKIVGWSMQERLTTPLVTDALHMAFKHRRPTQDLLHHSDRGSQYASADYQQLLQLHGVTCSMGRTANCYDNAMMESFFATLKAELTLNVFSTRDEARYYLFDFIEVWYNRQRRHSALNYCSPDEFERRHTL